MAYLALAEALDVTLLTGDERLARATGPRCRVEMLRPASLSAASPSFLLCRPEVGAVGKWFDAWPVSDVGSRTHHGLPLYDRTDHGVRDKERT